MGRVCQLGENLLPQPIDRSLSQRSRESLSPNGKTIDRDVCVIHNLFLQQVWRKDQIAPD